MNGNNLKPTFAALVVLALCWQMLAFDIAAQKMPNREASAEMPASAKQNQPQEAFRQSKIAPDLEEKTGDLAYGRVADKTQKVIIQLKSETGLDEMLSDDVSEAARAEMAAVEVRSNKERAVRLNSELYIKGGRINKSFNRVGLVAAELPLSKVRELAVNEDVAYISPDRETAATGHIETTTGTSQIRPLLSTTVNGAGIGIAILDSGIEGMHADFKPLIISRVVHHRSFITGNTATADKFGHGTHVAGLAAGNDIFSNGASGYYNGVSPNSSLLNLRSRRQWTWKYKQRHCGTRLDHCK